MTELHDDMEGRLEGDLRFAGKDRLAVTRTADLRALLLAYQERGRALEARTPAPEGEAVEAGDIAQMTCFANNHGALEDWAAWCRIRASLASPVVPVGVSKEEIIAILESYIGASTWPGDSDAEVHGISEAADAILAALRPDDTGRE